MSDAALLKAALSGARDTRGCLIGPGVRRQAGEFLEQHFHSTAAVTVTDPNAWAAAGRDVADAFRSRGIAFGEPVLLDDPSLYAEESFFQQVLRALSIREGVPVALGAGS